MLYAGLDLCRKRRDYHVLDADGVTVDVGASPPDADGLRGLSERLDRVGFRNSVTGGFSSSTRSAAGSVSLGYVRLDQARSSGQRGRRIERV
jgi:hypothetical protein